MAKGKGTSTGVKFLSGDSEFLDAVSGLGSEGFVDFEDVDFVLGNSGFLEGSGDGEGGANSHDVGRNTLNGVGEHAADNLDSEGFGNGSSCEQDAGSAVSNLGRVSSSGGATLLESGLQFAETGEGSLGADAVVSVNEDRSGVAVLVLDGGGVRSDFLLGPSLLVGFSGLSMTVNGKLVLGSAVNSELLGDVLGGDSHRHEASLGIFAVVDLLGKEGGIKLVHHGVVAHGLDTTADTDSNFASLDGVGNSGDSLETGGAETVNTLDRGGSGVASEEGGHAGGSGASTALEHASDNNVFNFALFNSSLGNNGFQDGLEHGFSAGVSLGALLSAGHGGTGHADDNDIIIRLGADGLAVEVGVVLELLVEGSDSLHFENGMLIYYIFKVMTLRLFNFQFHLWSVLVLNQI